MTFGQQHLVLWQLMPDKTGTERKTCLNVGPLTRLRATDMQLLQDSHSRSHKETERRHAVLEAKSISLEVEWVQWLQWKGVVCAGDRDARHDRTSVQSALGMPFTQGMTA